MDFTFTWDVRKALINQRLHGVSFEEAAGAFGDPLARIHDDPHHSIGERREILVGHSVTGRLLLVVFTERKRGIRIISARRVTRHERRDYEAAAR